MEKVKEIISSFLKISPGEITENTVIGSRAIPGSVLIHRMYSMLSKEGYNVSDYKSIETYGELVSRLKGASAIPTNHNEKIKNKTGFDEQRNSIPFKELKNNVSVGIDIEDIANMPEVDDYREDAFYTDNFSSKEIAYCILQANPKRSFAGKFAAKEAIVKADNFYINKKFNIIEINSNNGRPEFDEFSISISHTDTHAIAVAIKAYGQIASKENSKSIEKEAAGEIIGMNNDSTNKSTVGEQIIKLLPLLFSLCAFTITVYLLYRAN